VGSGTQQSQLSIVNYNTRCRGIKGSNPGKDIFPFSTGFRPSLGPTSLKSLGFFRRGAVKWTGSDTNPHLHLMPQLTMRGAATAVRHANSYSTQHRDNIILKYGISGRFKT